MPTPAKAAAIDSPMPAVEEASVAAPTSDSGGHPVAAPTNGHARVEQPRCEHPAEALAAADSVLARCDAIAACTEEPGRVTRRFLTPAMRDAHDCVRGWMETLGLSCRLDAAGNLIGRRLAAPGSPTLLVGSHLDSVPGGGRYDGVLGVTLGLAVVEALGETSLPFYVDVVAFSEEEGVRFAKPYLGSAALAGWFREEWLGRTDADGVSLAEAIRAYGLDPATIPQCAYRQDEVLGFVEPHLEQGPVLERAGVPLGVVTGVAGQSRLRLVVHGEAGHAGTTPMDGRQDALVAAARIVADTRAQAAGDPDLRATVGHFRVTPDAPNVIPERVDFSLDVRHPVDAVRDAVVERITAHGIRSAAEDCCRLEVLEHTPQAAVGVDPQLSSLLAEAAAELGPQPVSLPSGAGHDTVAIAERFPVAMLFVRHPGGVSHHPDERVDRDDVAAAVRALTGFVTRLADRVGSADPSGGAA